jgi:hypothetical protein
MKGQQTSSFDPNASATTIIIPDHAPPVVA